MTVLCHALHEAAWSWSRNQVIVLQHINVLHVPKHYSWLDCFCKVRSDCINYAIEMLHQVVCLFLFVFSCLDFKRFCYVSLTYMLYMIIVLYINWYKNSNIVNKLSSWLNSIKHCPTLYAQTFSLISSNQYYWFF